MARMCAKPCECPLIKCPAAAWYAAAKSAIDQATEHGVWSSLCTLRVTVQTLRSELRSGTRTLRGRATYRHSFAGSFYSGDQERSARRWYDRCNCLLNDAFPGGCNLRVQKRKGEGVCVGSYIFG
jgi:hypothetical protein